MIVTIESRQNPRVKELIRLRERSERKRTGHFLIEGFREIQRAHEAGIPFLEVYYCPDLFKNPESATLINDLDAAAVPLIEMTRTVFEKASYREGPDGLLAVAATWEKSVDTLSLPPNSLLLLVEAIEKPGNLGALIRTADAAGVDAVLVCDPVTDIFNPNVIRASQGSLFSLPIVSLSSTDCHQWLQSQEIRIVATTPSATTTPWEADLTGPTAILAGSEKDGLSPFWLENADTQIRIPMQGQADSLNVSASTAIVLYEALRQRSVKSS